MPYDHADQDYFNFLWRLYIEPTLGKKPLNQFLKATRSPSNWFAETIVRPRLFQPDAFGGVYYPVDLTPRSVGRNHHLAEIIAMDPDPVATYGGDPWTGLMLFANPLRVWSPVTASEDAGADRALAADAPKDRVVLGDYHVLTYEFDRLNIDFLKFQLSWLRDGGETGGPRMQRLFQHCSQFAEFAGITVNWSGHKSLHIHVVFSTRLARAKLGLDGCTAVDLRRGFSLHWERLHEDVLSILGVQGKGADEQLRFPESFRRVPNGCRVIGDSHLLGIPAGTLVPQITLFEKTRERAAGDELPMFWTPEPFQATVVRPMKTRQSGTIAARTFNGNMSPDERAYCEAELSKWYPDWPRFDHLAFEGQRWVAKFRNSEADRNPASVMREDYASIHLVGRDAGGLKAQALPYELGVMLRLWCGQLARQQGREDEAVNLDDIIAAAPPSRVFDPLEEQFRANVRDGASARSEMESFFRTTVATIPLMMVVGPEGVGKTSVLMALHHEFTADLEQQGEGGLAMYAFADYDTARAKCAAFNAAQAANGYVGVVIPSFSKAYEEECNRLGMTMISNEQAARIGHLSRWAAIEKHQRVVIQSFRARHTSMWAEIGTRKPVFFTVHQTAHEWRKSSPTRLMWAPSFWSLELDAEDRINILRRETDLGLLIHDEVKWQSIVDAQPEAAVRWVEDMTNADWQVWGAHRPKLPELLASYEAFVAAHGDPVVAGQAHEVRPWTHYGLHQRRAAMSLRAAR